MKIITDIITEGKGKRVYATENPDEAIVYYKDEAIAFHGLKRGRIIGKGEINNRICEYMFTLLSQQGVPNHFIGRVDERSSLVRRVTIIPVVVKVRNIVAGSLARRTGYPEGTRLNNTVIEYCLKDTELDDPLVNLTHITAMGLATAEEIRAMESMAVRVNDILTEVLREISIELIDFKLEFGRFHGEILVSDEISPDTCRFWDASTHEPLDIDRFRRDLGDVAGAYREVLHRLTGYAYQTNEEEP
ncbi:MAG: phosphoribosylaminoimidazolesuccinocarboxamide synthase [Candidatus Limiplasma sp.]|nr:phosphoribosylaminoimidazolesuccinocarboxamide synthase [Candidatus Limiplasma sp.]MEA5145611.1 phosphoribosylaminoimidazolesuccinocarboxamide synthase [Candidatus Limiplasma sp.]